MRRVRAAVVSCWRLLRYHPAAWLAPLAVGAWGVWIASAELELGTAQGQWAAGLAMCLALMLAAWEHERTHAVDAAAQDRQAPPGLAGVVFLCGWGLALNMYAGVGMLLCLLVVAALGALRAGGPWGALLGIAWAWLLARLLWVDRGDFDPSAWWPALGLEVLAPSGQHALHATWVKALGTTLSLSPAVGQPVVSLDHDASIPVTLGWVLHAMQSLGRAPVALLLMVCCAAWAALAAALAQPRAAEQPRQRTWRRVAVALWTVQLALSLAFVAWVYGLHWLPAVPGLVPFTGNAAHGVLFAAALACTLGALLGAGAGQEGVRWARPAVARAAALAALLVAVATVHGSGLAHAQRLQRLTTPPPEPEEPVPDPPARNLPSAEQASAVELGQAVLMLMPDPDTDRVGWDHRWDSAVTWLDDPVRSWRGGLHGVRDHRRVGLLRVHVQGQSAQALRQRWQELWWTVMMEAEGHLRDGVQTLTLRPGGGQHSSSIEAMCFGPTFKGCQFPVLPSLHAAGIQTELLCEWRDQGEHLQLFELRQPQRRTTWLSVLDGESAHGRFTELTMLLSPRARTPCAPR